MEDISILHKSGNINNKKAMIINLFKLKTTLKSFSVFLTPIVFLCVLLLLWGALNSCTSRSTIGKQSLIPPEKEVIIDSDPGIANIQAAISYVNYKVKLIEKC